MPSDFALKTMNRVHRTLLAMSFGKIGWSASDMPVLELHTIGRTSGQRRSVMLTSPVQDGDSLIIVASRGGDDHHPAWFLNLQANPDVHVTIRGRTTSMHARIAEGDERAALWQRVITDHTRYAGYQSKTERKIPLVVLTPNG
ncbi:MAG: nitroreductase family deazaflavin-dependent oxidoreductase [Actinomycetota bacterium]|nr:nitroreductase family deazaflavin-dependent oxidoreductase [Actinomycetota bacterium]